LEQLSLLIKEFHHDEIAKPGQAPLSRLGEQRGDQEQGTSLRWDLRTPVSAASRSAYMSLTIPARNRIDQAVTSQHGKGGKQAGRQQQYRFLVYLQGSFQIWRMALQRLEC